MMNLLKLSQYLPSFLPSQGFAAALAVAVATNRARTGRILSFMVGVVVGMMKVFMAEFVLILGQDWEVYESRRVVYFILRLRVGEGEGYVDRCENSMTTNMHEMSGGSFCRYDCLYIFPSLVS